MRSRFLALAAAAALSACGRTPFPTLEAQLGGLRGQPVAAAIEKLGAPDSQSATAAEKVYVWSTETAAASVDASIGLRCAVRVFADRDERIARYDFDGNVGGCARYAHLLDKSFRLVNWPAE
ncbi:MAG: hypothetical protein ABR970_05150 [Roseiarcus sp.]|jgi:hypothetical protein